MALPLNDELGTLDYDDSGMPGSGASGASDIDTSLLDIDAFGMPMGTASMAPSFSEGRITQVAIERLSQTPTLAYITQVAIEALMVNPPEARKGTSWNRWDHDNTFEVTLLNGTLTSAADDVTVLNGANMALLGDEIIQFKTVTSLGSNRYRLSVLLRGRFGTEWAMNSHSPGERFVILSPFTVTKLHESRDDISTTRLYKLVNTGQTLSTSIPYLEYHDGVALMPYAPCHIKATRDGSDNITLTWHRRTRVNGAWRDYVDIPVGETEEAYEIDVLDSTGAVVRTIDATAETAAYSAADQTTDFGGPQSTVTVIVYQISEAVGRGYGAQANV